MVMLDIFLYVPSPFLNNNYFFMESTEIYNLFGEPLSDEIESRVMKNKTLSFKKKSKATKEYN